MKESDRAPHNGEDSTEDHDDARRAFLDDDAASPAHRVVSGVRSTVAARGGAILLLDAYPDWLSFVAFILRRRGHDVACAQSASEARALLDAHASDDDGQPFDVIVCGLMDGAVALLSEAKSRGSVRTVALSRDGLDLFGLPRGTVDMPLLRPVPIAALVEAVESFLPHNDAALG